MARSLKTDSLPKIPHQGKDKAYIKIYKKRSNKSRIKDYRRLPIFIRAYYVVNLSNPVNPILIKTVFTKRSYASKAWEMYLKEYALPKKPYKILSGKELYKYVDSLYSGEIEMVIIIRLSKINTELMQKDYPDENRKSFRRKVNFFEAEREKQFKRRNVKNMAELGYVELTNHPNFNLKKILKLADKIRFEKLLYNYNSREDNMKYQYRIDNKYHIHIPLLSKSLMSLYLALEEMYGKELSFSIHSAHGLFYKVWRRYLEDEFYIAPHNKAYNQTAKELKKFYDKNQIIKELKSLGFEEYTRIDNYFRDRQYIVYFNNMRKTDEKHIKMIYPHCFPNEYDDEFTLESPDIRIKSIDHNPYKLMRAWGLPLLRLVKLK